MIQGHEVMHVCGSFMGVHEERDTAPRLVQRTTWPLTVGRNRLYESKNTKERQARMDEKFAPSSHTPSLLLLRLFQWMDAMCALLCSIKLYPLIDIMSRMLFLFWDFWDLGFRTWTDRQTPPLLLLYIRW